ncbi:MAG: ABC transporter permease, partial [Verrucomicrobiales bacterium]|nr:ABC transporter permease [Verrucomicrobiales bacterium]
MNLLHKVQLRFKALFHKRKLDVDMDEEMKSHIEMRTQQNLEAGLNPEEARYAALRQFGWTESIKETCRETRGVTWLEQLTQDVRFGARMLGKNRGFASIAVLTLALGIGANTAIFSVVNAVLLRPLPYRDADRLITIWERNPQQGYDQNMAATGTFLDWKEQSQSFEDMAIFESNQGLTLTSHGDAEQITATKTSANLFSVLGVNPLLGRSFISEEETTGREQVVILSHGLWKRRFGSDPGIIGNTITLNGKPFEVVGVMPQKIKFPGMTGIL